jgi:methionyl-tRNA synthetase
MVFKNCDKAVPMEVGPFTEEAEALLASAKGLHERAVGFISEQDIQKYANELIEMVCDANKYIDTMAPWILQKMDPERMATVLYVVMEVLRHVDILYQPIIPTSANKILDLLTVPEGERTFDHDLFGDEYKIKPGTPVPKSQGVFPRIKMPVEDLVEA